MRRLTREERAEYSAWKAQAAHADALRAAAEHANLDSLSVLVGAALLRHDASLLPDPEWSLSSFGGAVIAALRTVKPLTSLGTVAEALPKQLPGDWGDRALRWCAEAFDEALKWGPTTLDFWIEHSRKALKAQRIEELRRQAGICAAQGDEDAALALFDQAARMRTEI